MALDHRLVVLVFQSGPGTRFAQRSGKIYYAGEQELGDGRRGSFPTTKHLFNDEVQRAKHLSHEHAVSLRKLLRAEGYVCHIEDRFGNVLYEREKPAERSDDKRCQRFVPFTNGLGLIAIPGHTPAGPTWFVRASDVPSLVADGRHTAVESVSGQTPEEAAERAVASWGAQILFPDPEAAARAEAEARAEEARRSAVNARLRPGDRY